jgi:hypothetical protein
MLRSHVYSQARALAGAVKNIERVKMLLNDAVHCSGSAPIYSNTQARPSLPSVELGLSRTLDSSFWEH